MIDHDYKILTREIAMTASRAKHFIAELSDVYIIVDGKRLAAQYPQQTFSGKTQTAAMIQAGDALRNWLEKENHLVEDSVVLSL